MKQSKLSGKLRIGDDWNAINIIALSQSNPLKAVAEFIENSIDAHAKNITITRGREGGESYLRILDDGDGIPLDEEGRPNFKYVATHICDSLKRQMKAQGAKGIQGEFGIGLLSFWTVGESLSLVSPGSDGKTYEMRMTKGNPNYEVAQRRRLVAERGTQLTIQPLLSGIRHFSGEKLQWYLASELRDRIRNSGVSIRIIDRLTRGEFIVEPREFSGQALHQLAAPDTEHGKVYIELYLCEPRQENRVGLYRGGTRVLDALTELEVLQRPPWTSSYLQGIVDAPFLNLTPGSRLGVIQDDRFAAFCEALGKIEADLVEIVSRQQQAEEEQASRDTLKAIQRAFREALLALPEEEYDWFEVLGPGVRKPQRQLRPGAQVLDDNPVSPNGDGAPAEQREFFEHAGPLYSVRVSPASSVLPVGQSRNLRAIPRDRERRQIESDVQFRWELIEGEATLTNAEGEIVTLAAPAEPQLVKLRVTASQGEFSVSAEALVTVTDSILPDRPKSNEQRGLPEYTFEKAPGELWRSRFDAGQNLILVNSGHRDFVFAARNRTLKLRYLSRLFAKELVLHNFPGATADQLLERMIELSLYTEEHLR